MYGKVPGTVIQTIDNPDDPEDQLVLVESVVDGVTYQRWYHGSELIPRKDDE